MGGEVLDNIWAGFIADFIRNQHLYTMVSDFAFCCSLALEAAFDLL